MVMVVVVVLLVTLVEVVALTWLGPTGVHVGLGSSSIPGTVIAGCYISRKQNSCLSVSPVVVRGVGLVVLSVTVGRGAVLISVLTTGTRLELLLVSALALAGVTEGPILETVLLTRT